MYLVLKKGKNDNFQLVHTALWFFISYCAPFLIYHRKHESLVVQNFLPLGEIVRYRNWAGFGLKKEKGNTKPQQVATKKAQENRLKPQN